MRSKLIFSCILALLATSCSTVNVYRSPIEELSKGTAQTRAAIESLALDVNDLTARNRAWVAASKGERFGDRELAPIIAPAFIEARVGGILMIERLAARMLSVVDSQAGTGASQQVVTAAADIKTFAQTIDPRGPVKDYALPLGSLAQIVMDLFGDQERQAILEKAIRQGVPVAKQLLAVLERDFKPGSTTSIDAVNIEELRSLKAEQIRTYDKLLADEGALSPTERGALARVEARYALLQRVIATQRILDGAANASVHRTLGALGEALDALLSVAEKKDVAAGDLRALVQSFSTFASNAAALTDAVRAVKQASAGQGPQ